MDETDVKDAPVSAEPIVSEPEISEEVTPEARPGDKTEPNLLLKSLQEERAKVKQLQEELSVMKNTADTGDVFSDEGKALLGKIATLEARIASKEESELMASVQTKFPVLKDKAAEFEIFRSNPDNAGMKLDTAARVFLAENNLLASVQPRKGLERNTGGGRIPPSSGEMTPEDIDELRNNDYRKYSRMVREGKIKI